MLSLSPRITALALAALMMTGCISQPTPQPRPSFPVAEYNALPTTGSGTVEGQVFMKTVGGDVKYGAGSQVVLNPVTSYSEHWYRTIYEVRAPIQDGDPRQSAYVKTTRADGSGNFQFTEVPPGRYFLTSEVRWQAPSQWGLTNQGGQITDRITVTNDKTTKVMLTR
ncbi:hypothetical protein KI429_05715 [Pseudomonas shirazica]|nr:hypothetical protein KI429_05715 [Pseudomonas shirazica]